MLVFAHERLSIARLLQFLLDGERLAHECARTQAGLVNDAGMQRFLLGQARQESYHALLFQGAVAWLAPRRLGDCPVLMPLSRYRRLMHEALARGDLYETFVAEQIILEGLGEAILARIEAGLAKRGAPFRRVRRMLLYQEAAHHHFGLRAVERSFEMGISSPDAMRCRAQEYLALADAMVQTVADLLETLDEDPCAYVSDARRRLPAWLSAEYETIPPNGATSDETVL